MGKEIDNLRWQALSEELALRGLPVPKDDGSVCPACCSTCFECWQDVGMEDPYYRHRCGLSHGICLYIPTVQP